MPHLNTTDKMHVIETGCHVDGSHWSALDFNCTVVGYAQRLGMELKPEEQAFIENPGDQSDPNGYVYEHSLELADAAESWLNQHTESGYVWHVEEQSLFLTSEADLEDSWYGR